LRFFLAQPSPQFPKRAILNGVLKQLIKIHEDKDYLTHELILQGAQESDAADYSKRDFLFRKGVWRGEPQHPIFRKRLSPRNLVVGHSDHQTNFWQLVALRALTNYRKFWVCNLEGKSRESAFFSTSVLPLGLTNPTTESILHRVYGDSSILRIAFRPAKVWTQHTKFAIYGNFSVDTGKKWRTRLMEIFDSQQHLVRGDFVPSIAGREMYLRDMQTCGLVVCPRGNGMDTHRFYEALYMGALPIVLESSYSARLALELSLPVVKIRSWEDLKFPDQISEQALELGRKDWDLSPLRGSFWKDCIFGKKENNSNG